MVATPRATLCYSHPTCYSATSLTTSYPATASPPASADLAPGKVAPLNGTTGRYLVQEALNYTASEYHATVGASCMMLTHEQLQPASTSHRSWV